MNSERDTHFRGTAKMLLQDMGNLQHTYIEFTSKAARAHLERLIARRLYDVFIHDRMNTGTSDLQHAASRLEAEELVNGIPDMKKWPE